MESPIKDEEVRENLQEISKNVQSVGRFIGGKRLTVDNMTEMGSCLRTYADLIDKYHRYLKTKTSAE